VTEQRKLPQKGLPRINLKKGSRLNIEGADDGSKKKGISKRQQQNKKGRTIKRNNKKEGKRGDYLAVWGGKKASEDST